MSVLDSAKAFATRRLPLGVLNGLKKLHYPRRIRSFSEPEVAVVRRLIEPGDVAVDVGAHVGWYTNVLSECVGVGGTVYSIEPIPMTHSILKHCVKRLGLKNVRTLEYGVSDVDRRMVMTVPTESGEHNFYRSSLSGSKLAEADLVCDVEVRSLDSIFANSSDNISFIKFDVEAHELEAVTGAATLLGRCHPALLVEVSGDPDVPMSRAHQLFEMLRGHGYSAWWYDGSRLRPRGAGDRQVNYFFLTSRHVERLRHAAPQFVWQEK